MKSFLSKLKIFLVLIILLGLLILVIKAGYQFYLVRKNFEKYNSQLSELKEKNEKLREKIAYLKNLENLEIEARSQMNLIRKGEKVIVILPKKKSTSSTPRNKNLTIDLIFGRIKNLILSFIKNP